MKNRRVRFTATARQHVLLESTWWLENREHAEVFADELEHALRIVSSLPGAGTPYADSPVTGVRRIYLRRITAHLYYTFDQTEVIIRALWGARRRHGPQLDA